MDEGRVGVVGETTVGVLQTMAHLSESYRTYSFGSAEHSRDGSYETFDCIGYTFKGLGVVRFAFPNDERVPTQLREFFDVSSVARDVCIELRGPELHVRSWGGRANAPRVTVPKATVHEHGQANAREDDVRCAGEVLRVQPVPKTTAPERTSQKQLRFRIAPLDAAHAFGRGRQLPPNASGWTDARAARATWKARGGGTASPIMRAIAVRVGTLPEAPTNRKSSGNPCTRAPS